MSQHYGVLAQFSSPSHLYTACEKVRDLGFKRWDAHTPFPVHGLEKAMGLKPSRLPWIVLVMAILGGSGALTLQWWTAAVDYPLVISAKPLFSWQAFMPVTFELCVLCSALGCVIGMLALNGLPMWYHSLFKVPSFSGVTDDRFFISIESRDPLFDENKTPQLLKDLGALECVWVEA